MSMDFINYLIELLEANLYDILYYFVFTLLLLRIGKWFVNHFNEGHATSYYRKGEVPSFLEPLPPHQRSQRLASTCLTIPELFYKRVQLSSKRASWYEKIQGNWIRTNYGDWFKQSKAVAKGLQALGVNRGDRICIIGSTRGQWCVIDMGVQILGAISVGIYAKQTTEALAYLLEYLDAKVIFVEGKLDLDNVLAATKGNPFLSAVIPWEEDLGSAYKSRDVRVVTWSSLTKSEMSDKEVYDIIELSRSEDIAMFVYTSGTTGPPKAAMLTHRNILSVIGSMQSILPEHYEDDVSYSFLPMSHTSERILGFYHRISCGFCCCFASNIQVALNEILEIRPSVFGAVPRIFEKAHAKILSHVSRQRTISQMLFNWGRRVGLKRAKFKLANKRIPIWLYYQHALAESFILHQIRSNLFGGRLKWLLVGGGPVSIEILEFYWSLGYEMYEVYGMSESTVVTHANRPERTKLGTVGRPIPGAAHKLNPDGEILISGPQVFKGYYKNERATKEAIINGWLHTGDIGTIDDEEFLTITDRKKYIITLANGMSISPSNIESVIKSQETLISHVLLYGDKRPFLVALITPRTLETLEWGFQHGLLTQKEFDALKKEGTMNSQSKNVLKALEKIVVKSEFVTKINDAVRLSNEKVNVQERVHRFFLLPRDFSHDLAEVTPTSKVRRKEIERSFATTLEQLYR